MEKVRSNYRQRVGWNWNRPIRDLLTIIRVLRKLVKKSSPCRICIKLSIQFKYWFKDHKCQDENNNGKI